MDNKTKHDLLQEIENALGRVDFGSVEIIVQDKKVTQISVRSIKKTSIDIAQDNEIPQEIDKSKLFTVSARLQRLREQ